jgi:hypothetical protein
VPGAIPTLLLGLLDDAAVFPPGNAPLGEALVAHCEHRAAWYAPMIGPFLVPALDLGAITGDAVRGGQAGQPGTVEVGLIGPLEQLERALERVPDGVVVRQVECPVAKRGEDPQPGLAAFLALAPRVDGPAYAEVPLTWGLMNALDRLAEARAAGANVAPKFRTGGLAAELFPTPVELAAVICACRDRELPFKLTAGLHHAVRQTDPETGLVHHGFLNVLAAALVASDGGEPVDLAEVLGGVDALPLAEVARGNLHRVRPLWIGFGTCSIAQPLADLATAGLLPRDRA